MSYVKHICKKVNIVFICLLALTGCIEVDNFGDWWEQSGFDSDILGSWMPMDPEQDAIVFSTDENRNMIMTVGDVNDLLLKKTDKKKDNWLKPSTELKTEKEKAEAAEEADEKNEKSASDATTKEETLYTRSLIRGQHSFLLVKNSPDDKGGTLHFYRIMQQRLVFFRPAKAQRKAFLAKYGNRGVEVSKDQVRIPVLDAQAMNTLIAAADDPKYWEQANSYRRPTGREK